LLSLEKYVEEKPFMYGEQSVNFVIIFLAALCCINIAVFAYLWERRVMRRLNDLLDLAMAGDFDVRRYDESEYSRLESKLARFIAASGLRREQIQEDRDKVNKLIGDISHQTKTPLANLLLYTSLLQEQELSKEARELADQIAGSGDKLNFLIQSLVKASRLEKGILKITPVPSRVDTLLALLAKEYESLAAEKGITFNLMPMRDQLLAMFDPKWMTEALGNILDNGIKYTKTGGEIHILVIPYEVFVAIRIEDTGIGIKEENLTKIYRRFWRAPEVAQLPGLGIGLYLTREIVLACGGYMQVSSKPGVGTAFTVFLPIPLSLDE
jgi:signal transduction histidine kinase